jgi:hypothetical protein
VGEKGREQKTVYGRENEEEMVIRLLIYFFASRVTLILLYELVMKFHINGHISSKTYATFKHVKK